MGNFDFDKESHNNTARSIDITTYLLDLYLDPTIGDL